MYVNRLYHFYQKAIEDKKITIEEMEEYKKILTEYESAISNINNDSSKSHVNMDMHMEKLRHKAMKEAEAECETEILQKLKDKAKDELKSKLLFQDKN